MPSKVGLPSTPGATRPAHPLGIAPGAGCSIAVSQRQSISTSGAGLISRARFGGMGLDLGLAAIRELVHVETGLDAVLHLLAVSPTAEITEFFLAGMVDLPESDVWGAGNELGGVSP